MKIAFIVENDFFKIRKDKYIIFNTIKTVLDRDHTTEFISFRIQNGEAFWFKIDVEEEEILSCSIMREWGNKPLSCMDIKRKENEILFSPRHQNVHYREIGNNLLKEKYNIAIITCPWIIDSGITINADCLIGIVYDMHCNALPQLWYNENLTFADSCRKGYEYYNDNCDRIVCLTEKCAMKYADFYPEYENERIKSLYPVIPYYFQSTDLECSEKEALKRTNSVVLEVSQGVQGGIDYLADFINTSCDIIDTLYILGKGGCSDKLWDQFLNKLNVSHIVYYSKISFQDLRSIYSKSKVLLYPSTYGDSGIPIIEAQVFGCRIMTMEIEPMMDFVLYGHEWICSDCRENGRRLRRLLTEEFNDSSLSEFAKESFTCENFNSLIGLSNGDHSDPFNKIVRSLEAGFSTRPFVSDIDFRDITVVVQGAIEKDLTTDCLKSIRKHLPGARIVLSTWRGGKYKGFDYDELILCEDPGGVKQKRRYVFDSDWENNINRQLVSTQQGLSVVKTKYTLKLRSDMLLLTNRFLNYWDTYDLRDAEYSMFQHRVLISDVYSRHDIECATAEHPTPFHPSDWFFFGLTEDIKLYFEGTPLVTKEEAGEYYSLTHELTKEEKLVPVNLRYFCEQYIMINALMRAGFDVEMEDWTDVTVENIKQSEHFMLNNFVFLDFDHHGMVLKKYFWNVQLKNRGSEKYAIQGLYENKKFNELYNLAYNPTQNENNEYRSPFLDQFRWDVFSDKVYKDYYIDDFKLKAAAYNRLLDERNDGRFLEIDNSDITVVVQGWVDSEYYDITSESVRKYMSGAKLVLSTWNDCDVDGLDYDEIIISEDPGTAKSGKLEEFPGAPEILNNYNRQLISSRAGINSVSTKYTLKIRSDMILAGNGIKRWYETEECRDQNYSVFTHRILIGELYSRNSYEYYRGNKWNRIPTPFHPSDWFLFGRTEDVKTLFDNAKIMGHEELSGYKCINTDRIQSNNYPFSWRFPPEQQLCMGVVNKFFPDILFEDWTGWNEKNLAFSKEFMKKNFCVLNLIQSQLLNLKHLKEQFENTGSKYAERGLMTYDFD